MSKRFDVVTAIKALAKAALPGADVRGLDNATNFPAAVPANGLAIVREGTLEEIGVDLSPLTYFYRHRVPVELAGYQTTAASSGAVLDDMMTGIGMQIEADRTLAGLVDWLEAEPPVPDDIGGSGTNAPKGAVLILVAEYSTPNPLT